MLLKAPLSFQALSAMGLMAGLTALSWADDAFTTPMNASLVFQLQAKPLIPVQTAPSPKTEGLLRKTIDDLQRGTPDFGSMEPALQTAVKEQSQSTADIYRHLGALQTLKYIETRNGADIYRAVYQNAAVTYTIRMSPSGKISLLLLQPAFPWE
jgi:hypothetical protein